jgi:hypothetical protein
VALSLLLSLLACHRREEPASEPDASVELDGSVADASVELDASVPDASVAVPGVTVRPSATPLVTTEESDGGASVQIVLDSEPTAPVTVSLVSSRPAEGTVQPASMTFTAASWSAPQTARVAGVDDQISDLDQAYAIEIGVSSADPRYQGKVIADVAAINLDDELLRASPSPLAFGATPVATQTAARLVTVSNSSSSRSTSHLGGVTVNPNDFVVTQNSCTPTRFPQGLPPQAICQVQLHFAPQVEGEITGSLVLNAELGGTVTVPLTGTGTPRPPFSIAPASHDYGEVAVGAVRSQGFTLTNDGSAELTGVTFTPGSAALTVTTTGAFGCTSTLAVASFCQFQVAFTAPATTGAFTGAVAVEASSVTSPLNVSATVIP